MNIIADKAGKKFNKDWIFRHFNFSFTKGNSYAITGPNGSGKSTLLQVIGGSMNVTEGNVQYLINDQPVATDDVYRHVAIVAPYLEVIEEMTAAEFLQFHSVFKKLVLPVEEILSIVQLGHTKGKQIRNFSSGMKQRVKLAQAIFSDVPVLLLDEPCTNLDKAGYELYHSLINNYCAGKTVIVSSNDVNEYSFCNTIIDIMAYKSAGPVSNKIILTEDGFLFGKCKVAWNQVQKIEAYKVDAMTFDEMYIDIFLEDSIITLREDNEDFDSVVNVAKEYAGFDDTWRSKVILPAFAENRTILYQAIKE